MHAQNTYKETAINDIKQLDLLKPNNFSYNSHLGVEYYNKSNGDSSLKYLYKAHKLGPKNIDVLEYIGVAFVQLKKNTAKACPFLEKAITLGSNRHSDFYNAHCK